MKPIKTRKELETILKFLSEQGFGYFSDYEPHRRKIEHIINKNNTLNVDSSKDHKFRKQMMNLSDYDEAEKEAKTHFSKFKPDDKIYELLNNFYLQNDGVGKTPFGSSRFFNISDNKEIILWVKFRTKYGLKDDQYRVGENFYVYNFDKNYIKFNVPEYPDRNFKELYKLIMGEECLDFNNSLYGTWQDIGKMEIKFFQNGTANIKGGINKFKEYYINTLKNYHNYNIIIKDKKQTIVPPSMS